MGGLVEDTLLVVVGGEEEEDMVVQETPHTQLVVTMATVTEVLRSQL